MENCRTWTVFEKTVRHVQDFDYRGRGVRCGVRAFIKSRSWRERERQREREREREREKLPPPQQCRQRLSIHIEMRACKGWKSHLWKMEYKSCCATDLCFIPVELNSHNSPIGVPWNVKPAPLQVICRFGLRVSRQSLVGSCFVSPFCPVFMLLGTPSCDFASPTSSSPSVFVTL